ncbi:MAG: hypothetical protein ACI8TP_003364 [Acidimicrobiales bacterium]|jgi:uncharacterized protein YebE (UPF0316 family)
MLWYIPILIFLARICDVSIGTLRTVFVVSGYRRLSVVLGFFEVLIWVLAVGGVMQNLSEPLAVVGYAGGYATGILVGMTVEDKMAFGLRMIRVINPDPSVCVATLLRDRGIRVTRIEGSGQKGPVEVSFTVVRRKRVPEVREILVEHAPEAFITIERVDRADGSVPVNGPEQPESRFTRSFMDRLTPVRL